MPDAVTRSGAFNGVTEARVSNRYSGIQGHEICCSGR